MPRPSCGKAEAWIEAWVAKHDHCMTTICTGDIESSADEGGANALTLSIRSDRHWRQCQRIHKPPT